MAPLASLIPSEMLLLLFLINIRRAAGVSRGLGGIRRFCRFVDTWSRNCRLIHMNSSSSPISWQLVVSILWPNNHSALCRDLVNWDDIGHCLTLVKPRLVLQLPSIFV